jgi:hypothetical protein
VRPPEFDDLVEGVEDAKELDRLRRVHELLVEAGPPPDLSPALAAAPVPAEKRWWPWGSPRRVAAAFALAGALLAATFGAGYVAGESGSDEDQLAIRDTISLRSESGASGVVRLGYKGPDGNWPMLVTVEGLEPLRGGDYYTLALTKKGKPIVTCGTFNVADRRPKTITMSAAYNLEGFDGWVVLHYDAETHDDTPVLWTRDAVSA